MAWSAALPEGAEKHPVVWVVRGQIASSQQDRPGAIRCYWEALRRDPNQKAANAALAALLESEGRPEDAALFRERAELLAQFVIDLDGVDHRRDKGSVLHRLAEQLESLGRYWEAIGWCQFALALEPDDGQFQATFDRLQEHRPSDLVQNAKEILPAEKVDLSSYPLPVWKNSANGATAAADDGEVQIRLTDRVHEAGIDFVGTSAENPTGLRGGFWSNSAAGLPSSTRTATVGLTRTFRKCVPWPVDESQTRHTDRFFRNLGQDKFRDCTLQAGLGDGRFSQGIAAGDDDNDGFADLYLANIGQNRLYHNNGDGTFSDVRRGGDCGENRGTPVV